MGATAGTSAGVHAGAAVWTHWPPSDANCEVIARSHTAARGLVEPPSLEPLSALSLDVEAVPAWLPLRVDCDRHIRMVILMILRLSPSALRRCY